MEVARAAWLHRELEQADRKGHWEVVESILWLLKAWGGRAQRLDSGWLLALPKQ